MFFHRRLNLASQKWWRRRTKRKLQKFVVHADVLPHFEKEMLMMWENDTWQWTHSTLDGPLIRRHKKTLAKRVGPLEDSQPKTPESDGLCGSRYY